jgi:hypothetical protein
MRYGAAGLENVDVFDQRTGLELVPAGIHHDRPPTVPGIPAANSSPASPCFAAMLATAGNEAPASATIRGGLDRDSVELAPDADDHPTHAFVVNQEIRAVTEDPPRQLGFAFAHSSERARSSALAGDQELGRASDSPRGQRPSGSSRANVAAKSRVPQRSGVVDSGAHEVET